MLEILGFTGPIYITIVLGYAAVRYGLFARADLRVLGQFVIYLALPALVFNALAQRAPAEIFHLDYLGAMALGSLLMAALGWLWARQAAGQDACTSAYYGMGMSCANSGFVGYPIALLVLGPVAGVALALNMIVENLLMIPLLQVLAENGHSQRSGWRQVARASLHSLARNPLVLAIVAGLVFSLLGWRLPASAARTVGLFAQASSALSLFVIGGSLTGLQAKGMGGPVLQISLGKLLLHPLAVWAATALWEQLGAQPMSPPLRNAAVLMAAMPMMGIFPILAQRHGREGLAAAALLGATVLSFFSISGLLWLMRHQIGWIT